MNAHCPICLLDLADDERCHARCARQVFGSGRVPVFDIELSKLHTAALAMVGHTSLSGAQRKISVNISSDRHTLQVAAGGSRFILKPQTGTYPALPENEHLTMRLAVLSGLEVGSCGLIELQDKSLGFIVRRFDRRDDGTKVRQEDFCQLAEKSPKEKYDGSAELCVRLLRNVGALGRDRVDEPSGPQLGHGAAYSHFIDVIRGGQVVHGREAFANLVLAVIYLIPQDGRELPIQKFAISIVSS